MFHRSILESKGGNDKFMELGILVLKQGLNL